MKVTTTVKAGGTNLNHNEAQARAAEKASSLKVKTSVKAGGRSMNHSEAWVSACRQ